MKGIGRLARLGGAREDILRRTPGERTRHTSMGAVLISTAAVAAVSAGFAVSTAMKLDPFASVAVGILWGLAILNLDRMLIVTMQRQDGVLRSFIIALPRVALALILGAVISMPLVLRIFEPEINAELDKMRVERLQSRQTQIDDDARYAAIPELQKQVQQLTLASAGADRASPTTDQRVQELEAIVTSLRLEYQKANNAVLNTTDGQDPAAERAELQRVKETLDEASRRLDARTKEVQKILDANAGTFQSDASVKLKAAAAELERLTKQKEADEAAATSAENSADGLINRLDALDRLSTSPTLTAARWALFALLASIEILPVLVKLLSLFGRETAYDRLSRSSDENILSKDDADNAARRQAEDRRAERHRIEADTETAAWQEAAAARVETATAIERDRMERQIEAAGRQNAKLVDTQERIADRALVVWGEIATLQTEQTLQQWRAAQPAVLPRAPVERNGHGGQQRRNGSSGPVTEPQADGRSGVPRQGRAQPGRTASSDVPPPGRDRERRTGTRRTTHDHRTGYVRDPAERAVPFTEFDPTEFDPGLDPDLDAADGRR